MKGLALSYTLLTGASLVASQTTVWEDFTATVSVETLSKPIVASTSSVTSASASASASASSSASAGTTTTSSSVNFPTISPSFIYQNSSSASTSIAAALVPTGGVSISSSAGENLYAVTTTSPIISTSPADSADISPSSTLSSSQSSQTTLDAATATAILNEHNTLRALHVDTQPLIWSDDLSAWAYDYANTLTGTNYDPCSGNLVHSTTRGNQGENIAFATYSDPTALVDLWYDEIQYYDYNNVTGIYHDGQEVGHFTQVVWNASTAVGCAAIECAANNGLYLLCEYTPAGNVYDATPGADVYGEFKTNVLPLITS